MGIFQTKNVNLTEPVSGPSIKGANGLEIDEVGNLDDRVDTNAISDRLGRRIIRRMDSYARSEHPQRPA